MTISWDNVLKIIILTITSAGGIGGIFTWLMNIQSSKLLTEYENRTKTIFEIYKDSNLRYNQQQFEKYNEIWTSLFALKMAADSLWIDANANNLWDYSVKLKNAFSLVGKNALFIEEIHYKELIELFQAFGSYEDGKKNLLTTRLISKNNLKGEIFLIENNQRLLEQYTDLVEIIRKSFRNQLHQKNPAL